MMMSTHTSHISSYSFFFGWRAPQPWGLLCNPVRKIASFVFPCNGAPVEWNWQGKPEVLGEKPFPVPLGPPQIPHGLTRDRTRTSAVRGPRLTARPRHKVRHIPCTATFIAPFSLYSLRERSNLQPHKTARNIKSAVCFDLQVFRQLAGRQHILKWWTSIPRNLIWP
jgi:hypothetical protein